MNDFTREELEEIYYHLENESLELYEKIKYMIENYCEHVETSQISDVDYVEICETCDEIVGYN